MTSRKDMMALFEGMIRNLQFVFKKYENGEYLLLSDTYGSFRDAVSDGGEEGRFDPASLNVRDFVKEITNRLQKDTLETLGLGNMDEFVEEVTSVLRKESPDPRMEVYAGIAALRHFLDKGERQLREHSALQAEKQATLIEQCYDLLSKYKDQTNTDCELDSIGF